MLVFGLRSGGDTPLVTDMTNKYTGTVLAIGNTVGQIGGIAGPSIIGYIVNPDQYSIKLWSYAFYSGAILNTFGIITFLIWADPSIQPWDNDNTNYNENINIKIQQQNNSIKKHYNGGYEKDDNKI